MGIFKSAKQEKTGELAQKQGVKARRPHAVREYPLLMNIRPNRGYVFHSDYFEIDNGFASILSFFHRDGAYDNFGAFWGVNRIPSGLPSGVTVILFEQMARQSEGWIKDHQSKAESIVESNLQENEGKGTHTSYGRSRKKKEDQVIIAQELQQGASYVHVHYRLLVKAPSLELLDEALDVIDRLYIDRFGTFHAAPYHGDQRAEFSNLFFSNKRKQGPGYYYTSTELAGSYSLVTQGLSDLDGEYVGSMMGDVNNAAVLFNVNGFDRRVVVAMETVHEKLGRLRNSDLWASKLSQSCLIHNHKVVHIVMNDADLDKMGPKFAGITTKINMNKGDVNMFEVFGDVEDELGLFASQLTKLGLMNEQACETTDADRAIIRGVLEEVATQFYVDNNMWRNDAQHWRDRLRLVGIPHEDVPKLEMFCTYLDTAYDAATLQQAKDAERIHALNVLKTTFKTLLRANGDLFNVTTSPLIDHVNRSRRVIYEFSSLLDRSRGVAMAQLVNIIAFAVGHLGRGDLVIFHGAESIDDGIKEYIDVQLGKLYMKGGRVAYVYSDIEKMLDDVSFCRYDIADYSVFGNLTPNQVAVYQNKLGHEIPPDLAKLVTRRGDNICFIRRGSDNVVLRQDLALGLNKKRRTTL